MLKCLGASIAILLSVSSFAQGQLVIEGQDIGEIYQGHSKDILISIENPSDAAIELLSVSPTSKGDHVGVYPQSIAPKTAINVPVSVFSGADVGDHLHMFRVNSNSDKRPHQTFSVHLFGLSILEDAKPALDFGTVEIGKPLTSKEIRLVTNEVPNLQLERVLEMPNFVSVSILPDGQTIKVAPKPDAVDWGMHSDYVRIKVNSEIQPDVWVKVSADFHGDLVPSENPVDLGVQRVGDVKPKIIQLRARKKSAPTLGPITLSGFAGSVDKQPCAGNNADCTELAIRIADNQPTGRVEGTIEIESSGKHLKIDVSGWLLDAKTKIRMLDDPAELGPANVQQTTSIRSSGDLETALQKALSKPAPVESRSPTDAQDQLGPKLSWRVSNENGIYGYMIYRGDSDTGPFMRVNKEIVHVENQAANGESSSYVWRDKSATSQREYWYYIEIIRRDGTKQQLSGPQRVFTK